MPYSDFQPVPNWYNETVTAFEYDKGIYMPVFERELLKGKDTPADTADVLDTPPAPAPDSAMQKRVELEMREKEFIIEGTAESAFPNPYLVAGKPVTLENLGYSFSGSYITTQVKHTISQAGYRQELSLTRNATGLDFLTAPSQPAGEGRPVKPEVDPVMDDPVEYTVTAGDTLWGIAKKFYGNGAEYPKIVSANPSITDPNLIFVGQKFIIP